MKEEWSPPSLAEQLAEVKPSSVGRALLDELRRLLEERAERAVSLLDGHGALDRLPLRLPKGRVADLFDCERMAVARSRPGPADPGPDGRRSRSRVIGEALDRLVLLELHGVRVVDPVEEVLAVLEAQAELNLAEDLRSLAGAEPGLLENPAEAARPWAEVGSEWMPRTQVPVALHLQGGQVISSGRMDLELGGPPSGVPGVVVEVKWAPARMGHLEEVVLYALLAAFRDAQAPAAVARWYPGVALALMPADSGALESAARRLGAAIDAWAELVAGRSPVENPGLWCAWCPDADVCPSAFTELGIGEPDFGDGLHDRDDDELI